MFVAIYTTETAEIARGSMAFHTLIPLVFMIAAVYPEILLVMVERRGFPGGFRMTIFASIREARAGMVRVDGRIVFRRVAAKTGIGCIVIIAVMAGSAVVGYGCMCAIERIIVVVNGECSRRQVRGSGMAHRAIGRKIQRCMVRIGALIKIGGMASRTLRGRSGVARSMTCYALGRQVCARQREISGVVVKSICRTSSWVTGQAGLAVVGIPTDAVVVIVCLRVGMATGAAEFSVVRRIGMAIGAGAPFSVVFSAVNREKLRIVVERSRRPGCFCVAAGAIS